MCVSVCICPHLLTPFREVEQKKKVDDLDAQVKKALEERERSERERESARGDADQERKKLAGLLADLEDDALAYSVRVTCGFSYCLTPLVEVAPFQARLGRRRCCHHQTVVPQLRCGRYRQIVVR